MDQSVERISIELEKLLLRSTKPSIGLHWLEKMNLISRSIPMWGSLEKVFSAVDRAVQFRDRSLGWNLALMWSVATHHLNEEKLVALLDHLQIYTILGYKLRRNIIAGNLYWKQVQTLCTDTQLRMLSEEATIEQIAMISQAVLPGDALRNIERAKELGIENSSLPFLIQGRDLVPYGYKGSGIGRKLKEIREAQLLGQLQTRQQVLDLLFTEHQK